MFRTITCLMLQARLIDDFKGTPTLLFWGDNVGIAAMLDQVRGLGADRPAARVGSGENTVEIILSALSYRSHVRTDEGVSWECSAETLRRVADLIASLQNTTGHQYIDADGRADEVVISANEYQADFWL